MTRTCNALNFTGIKVLSFIIITFVCTAKPSNLFVIATASKLSNNFLGDIPTYIFTIIRLVFLLIFFYFPIYLKSFPYFIPYQIELFLQCWWTVDTFSLEILRIDEIWNYYLWFCSMYILNGLFWYWALTLRLFYIIFIVFFSCRCLQKALIRHSNLFLKLEY